MTWRPLAAPQAGIRLRQQALQPLDIGGAVLSDRAEAVEPLSQEIGERGEVALHRGAFLPALVDHLNEGAEADGNEKGNDECRHGTAQRRLCREQPMVGRFRDRLRQSLDRIGLDTRVRRMRARHALDPRRRLFAPCPEGTPRHSESTRFESRFLGLSSVNDSLIENKCCPKRIKASRCESETRTSPQIYARGGSA